MNNDELRKDFEKEMGCLSSAYEKGEGGDYEDLSLSVAWTMYQIAYNKREQEIDILKKALDYKEMNDSIGAPPIDSFSWITGYKESTHFWLREMEKREIEIVRLKKGLM